MEFGVEGMLGFAKRVTFVTDLQGVFRRVITEVNTAGHANQVLEALTAIY